MRRWVIRANFDDEHGKGSLLDGPTVTREDEPVEVGELAPLRELLGEAAEKEYEDAPWLCTKCGFSGRDVEPPGMHPNCSYFAVKVPSGARLYDAIRSALDLIDQQEAP